jgi:hypothetical protein
MSTPTLAYTTTTGDALVTRMAVALDALDGGYSINPRNGRDVAEGFAVAVYPEREQQYAQTVTPDEVSAFVFANADLLAQPGHVAGGWRDPSDGVAYLDVSRVVSTREAAEALGRRHNQLAYFDFAAGQSVPIEP